MKSRTWIILLGIAVGTAFASYAISKKDKKNKQNLASNDAVKNEAELHCNVDLGCSTMVAIKMAVESYRQDRVMLWDAENERVITR